MEKEYLEGEISDILGTKHTEIKNQPDESNRKINYKKYDYRDFKEKLINVSSTVKNTGDVIFMEIFKAEEIIDKEKISNIVNILNKNQLLYPVSFVIHKEETVLRNFINLRIAELRQNGELQRIINSNAIKVIKQEQIDESFIQRYDYSLIKKDYNEKCAMFSDAIKKEYQILDKVYGNYIDFQKRIISKVKEFRKDEKLNVLEIGCGTGITSEIILTTRNNFSNVILLDNDSEMISLAEENLKSSTLTKSDLNNVKFVDSDITSFLKSYTGEPFDLVISAYTIHNFNKECRKSLFISLYSKMSSNSLFINADKYAPNDEDERIKALNYRINKFTSHLVKKGNNYDLLNEWVTHYINDQSPNKVMKETESIYVLNEIGFKNIELDKPYEGKEMMVILTAKKEQEIIKPCP